MGLKRRVQAQSFYGTPAPLSAQNPPPIIAKADPTTSDIGYHLGQEWVNQTSGNIFGLGASSGGVATWTILGTVSSTFTTITSNAFVTSSATLGTTLNNNIWSATGSNAAIDLDLTPKGTGNAVVTTGDLSLTNGNVDLTTAGNGIKIKEGANARMGQSILVSGTVTVSNTSVTANTRIFISRATVGAIPGALGTLVVGTVTPGASFIIHSVSPTDGTTVVTTDVSAVNWLLIEKL